MRKNNDRPTPNLPEVPAGIVARRAEADLPPDSAPGAESGGLPLAHYIWLLRRNIWKIIACMALAVIATTAISVRLTPEYESTATLYVDRGAAKDIVGRDAKTQSSSVGVADADAYLASQVGMLQSDSVVRPLAEKFNLLEREKQIRETDPPNVQNKVRTAPIVLRGLRVARAPGTYAIQIVYRSTDREISTAVANGIAESYIEHTYDLRIRSSASLSKFMTRQLDELRAKMETSSAKLAALETELNVINPEEKTNILSARLLQVNSEYTKVQGDRVRAESASNALAGGSLEAGLASSQGDDLRAIQRRLNESRERLADVAVRFGRKHPEYERHQATVQELERQLEASRQSIVRQVAAEYARARNQEALLQKNVADTKAEYDHLNQRSFEYQRAKREAEADRTLYEELVRKIREDEINSGFQNDMVRLSDAARPASRAVYPNIPLNILLAFLLSGAAAGFVVLIADRVDTTIRNPEQISGGLGTRVIGTLPIIKTRGQGLILGGGPLTKGANGRVQDPEGTAFDEAVRTIRNSVLLTDFDRQLKSILMTSAVPSEGKSTVAAHLAVAHAQQRHKTLLIDGDMRRPSIHKHFDIPNTTGLSRVLDGELNWRDALVQPRPGLELYVMTAGPVTRRAAELVGPALPQLLADATEEFDLVVLDAPPLLGFPEPLQMAASVDGVIIVTKAGKTDRTGVAAVLNTLHDLRANVIGVILNEVRKGTSRSYYYYGDNYGKYYGTRKDDSNSKRT